jgi:ring-1,2-phenylacetyl-CoA epoxidase subunit PaaC
MPVETQTHLEKSIGADVALFALIQRLADNKYWLGRRYAEWCTSAPTLESAVAASAMAQDEIGHARSHYPLFRQFVGHDVEPEDRDTFHSMAALDRPFDGWPDFVVANFLIDTALTVLYQAAWESSFVDLRTRARRIIGEEDIHWLHGQGWVKRLARESTGTKEALELALAGPWREVLMWFGRTDDADARQLVDSGVIRQRPDELRDEFRKRVVPVMERSGLGVGLQHESRWELWDEERHRLRTG